MSERTSIVIADDHPIFRKGLKQTIEEDPTLEVVAEAGDGETALALIIQYNATVAVLDIDMPRMSGLQVARAIKGKSLSTAVIILTTYREEDMFDEAMDAGARGYVLKQTVADDLRSAINVVIQGEYFLSPTIGGYLANRSERAGELLKHRPRLNDLTPTERRILKLIALNKTSKDIADELFVSYRTIESHRTNIATKLNIHGSHSLLKFAIENKSAL
ncbi:MAG: response regulator transcription factor [Ignavibacteriae bacterium]|nr:response regulator transcription factor [Ignavibacteriota bacterium]